VSSDPFAFLEPLVELENKITELERLGESTGLDMTSELGSLHAKFEEETRRTFESLSSWQRVQLARHPQRPQASDFIDHLWEEVVPLAGDRSFADDQAIICGLGRLEDIACLVVGQQKGKDVHERRRCNFGSPHPEGYRKAMKKMLLAEKFRLPIVSLINTPGAFPGVGAEERGQSLAIAENIRDMFRLRVPIVTVVIGEGGSGGALGIGVGDRLLMLENSYYSVISPEGCAAILWKDGAMAEQAAESLRLTSVALQELGVVDEVVPEPAGGAHRQPVLAMQAVKGVLVRHLRELQQLDEAELLRLRYEKYRTIGTFQE
jgi:acetyl-CoA carboxylase carboxyl transferase subunit alpha